MKNNLKILLKENNKLEDTLYIENKDIITNIIVYIKFQGICEIDVEIIRKDIIGMALECQVRNKPFSSAIGEDYMDFSDKLIKSCTKAPLVKRLLELCFILTACATSLFLFVYTPFVIKNTTLNISITLDFLVSVLLAILTVPFVFKYFSKNTFKSNMYQFFALFVFYCTYIILQVISGIYLGHILVVNLNFLILFIILVVAVISVRVIDIYYTNNILLKKQCLR